MNERWRRVQSLFERALDRPIEDRRAWLARQTADDEQMGQQVLSLLAADQRPAPLDHPVVSPKLSSDAWIGRRLGPYRIDECIGVGGAGVVYRAVRDDDLYEAEVAIKRLKVTSDVDALLTESRILSRLHHPGIARLLDVGRADDGTAYLVMELVRGVPIHEYADQERLSIDQRIALFLDACAAIQVAHQNLVIHCDLKPENVLVDLEGRVRIVDFGVAQVLEGRRLDTSRALTPAYASPERRRGEPETTASDVFSLGVILQRLLTGSTPPPIDLEGAPKDPAHASQSVSSAGLPGLRGQRLRQRLRGDLDAIIRRARAPQATERYASVEQLVEDLRRRADHRTIRACQHSMMRRASDLIRRHRALALVIGTALVSLSVLTAVAMHQWRTAEAERTHAEIEAQTVLLLENWMRGLLRDATEPLSNSERGDVQDRIAAFARESRTKTDPHVRANLLDGLGQLALALTLDLTGPSDHRQPSLASTLLHEAWTLRRQTFGAESLEVALSLRGLARLAELEGRRTDAIDLAEERLRLHQTCPRGVHTNVEKAKSDLEALRQRTSSRERFP